MINIILATYNGEKYIKDQIDSVLSGTYKDIRFFAQDDGSTDSTVSILREYESANADRIKFRQNEVNKRSAANFFTALLKSDEEWEEPASYFMFCDQDDVWDKDKVEKTLKKMNEMEKKYGADTPLLVFTDSRLTDTEGNVINPSFLTMSHFNLEALDLPHILMENKAPGCTMMINRPLFEILKVYGSSEYSPKHMRMHDWWCMIAAAAFGHIGVLPEATMSYRQHGDNVVGGEKFSKYVKEKAANTEGARESLKKNIMQGKEFYEVYEGKTKYDEVLCAFAGLPTDSFIGKRVKLIKYKFAKSGILRNIGVFVLI